MSRISFKRKTVKLRQVLGIRARLALLAVILVAPLMLERARSLEATRSKEIALASSEIVSMAKHSAEAQREVISSVATLLKSAAFIRASGGGVSRSCDILRASLPLNLPWIRNMMIAAKDGRIQCSTNNMFVGLDLSDRSYFKQAQLSRDFVFSDSIISGQTSAPIAMAAYPVSAISNEADAVILASVNLDWMSKIMGNLGGRPGVSAVLVDSAGVVLAAPSEEAAMVGRSLDTLPLLAAIAEPAMNSEQREGSLSFIGADGAQRSISFVRIADTAARLIVSIDEAAVTAAFDREIYTAYVQLGLVCLFVLFGALLAAEKLIIQPITILAAMAKRFGQGDLTARAARSRLPAEFVPLARAFNAMAAQLGQRERELVATNDRLTVIASIDMLSGLANRRGFQSRLDFEWLKAQQCEADLSLLMIDVDHFKLYNDTYGHPEGDVCLTRLGETLYRIAADTLGFAGRYGGEEFCLLLPNSSASRALEIGEMVRLAVLALEMPHATSNHQYVTVSVGVASTLPNDGQCPGDLIEAADAALYAAKRRGRNTVVEHGFVRTSEGRDGIAIAG
ncbi:diguanylate cyclase domain-containing protein [Bradyrhizobium sp.]|uniref:diguanylate cyclase domain-containing protein n=1 Tax=Bradyrhizobium sp. TaxID=376 RepID=UPI0025B7B131|nr:diguanylate cyclase [Bradyrhizobium sp.]MBV8921733.1 diguanylate cyclase [Bradyrhizobium sp.]